MNKQNLSSGNIVIYVVVGILVTFISLKFVLPRFGIDLFKGRDNSIEYSHADGFPRTINVSEEFNKVRLIITDQQKLKEAIEAIDKNKEIKIPQINFERKVALFVTSKTRNGSGYETRIKKIMKDNEDLSVEIRETEPGETCINTQQLNVPMDLIILDKVTASIDFDVVKYVKQCN